jgi:hypothetical protein
MAFVGKSVTGSMVGDYTSWKHPINPFWANFGSTST